MQWVSCWFHGNNTTKRSFEMSLSRDMRWQRKLKEDHITRETKKKKKAYTEVRKEDRRNRSQIQAMGKVAEARGCTG